MTPLSWPDDISFAAGPSVYDQMPSNVRAFATYAHCLVHRREAFNNGEFGMMGFANANYWSSAVQRCDTSELPHAQWRAQVIALAKKADFANAPSIQNWCQSHGFVSDASSSSPSNDSNTYFESRAVHELCATVLRAEQEQPSGSEQKSDHAQLKEFAEQVVASEIRILLQTALMKHAGIPVTNAESSTHHEHHVSTTNDDDDDDR